MLCPFCLQESNDFPSRKVDGKGLVYTCSRCGEAVPLRYVRDYAAYPPVTYSIIGMRGHGKTTYLASLLHELSHVGIRWPAFSYLPLDEEGLQLVREKQRSLEAGHLPESTPQVLPRPVILRLEGMTGAVPQCHLLIYDTAGEAFQQVSSLKNFASYVTRSHVVVFLVSITDLDHPSVLEDLLIRYVQASLEMDGDPSQQHLLIIFTKADRFAADPRCPEEIINFLLEPDDVALDELMWLEISDKLESWLRGMPHMVNFI
ncbi:MAG: hypothetical protein BWY76_01431 [bacterium ADurb.Bin429]|nr:MAG: hypothetical protein BWY76_01431 [bacterium ADurb.Bin429]